MNGDLSRVTFNHLNHYTRVVMQQGRVQLDADFNEQTAILLHYLQTLAEDIIGPYGGPEGKLGFEIKLDNAKTGWDIAAGRYYVNGFLCEIEENTPLLKQKDILLPNGFALLKSGTYLAYLDVWERHITPLDAPDIQDPALGQADTAARTKLTWQVKLVHLSEKNTPKTCEDFTKVPAGVKLSMWDRILSIIEPANRGNLKVEAKREPGADPAEPCVSSPEARFRGLENQLYRVEIHRGGTAETATFKWSRDNATVVAAYRARVGNEHLSVTGMRDGQNWFAGGDWVELTHDELELNGIPGIMVQLVSVDGESLRIDPPTAFPVGGVFSPNDFKNPKVRRWNHRELSKDPDSSNMDDGAMRLIEARNANESWLELEDGIRIQFQPNSDVSPAPHQYRTGDYWLIPARVAPGDVEWPGAPGVPSAVLPHGIEHHYAPLGVVALADGKPESAQPILDLRHVFSLNNKCVK